MMKRLWLTLAASALLMSLATMALAQGKSTTLTGHIVDKACSAGALKKENPQAAAAAHGKKCSLMEKCAASGFGVFADGKYYEFDEKGNGLAKAALEKSGKEKGATFKVVGKVSEGKMTVDSIAEVE